MGTLREQAIEGLHKGIKSNEVHIRNATQLERLTRSVAWRNCVLDAYGTKHRDMLVKKLITTVGEDRIEVTNELMAIERFTQFIEKLIDKGRRAPLLIQVSKAEISRLGSEY